MCIRDRAMGKVQRLDGCGPEGSNQFL